MMTVSLMVRSLQPAAALAALAALAAVTALAVVCLLPTMGTTRVAADEGADEPAVDMAPTLEVRNGDLLARASDFVFEVDADGGSLRVTEIAASLRSLTQNTSSLHSAIESTSTSAVSAVESINSGLNKLQGSSDNATVSLASAMSELSAHVDASVSNLTSTIQSTEMSIATVVAELSTNMQAFVLAAINSTMSSLISETTSADASIVASLSPEISDALSDVAVLRDGLNTSTIASLSATAALSAAIDSHEAVIANLSSEASMIEEGLEGTIEALTGGTISENEAAILEHADQLSTLAEQVRAQEEYQLQHEIAQAACVGLWDGSGWVYAVRRLCSESAPTCAAICAHPSLRQQDGQVANSNMQCFNSLHLYGRFRFDNMPDTTYESHKLAYKVHKYNGCGGGCGPNFCCCRV